MIINLIEKGESRELEIEDGAKASDVLKILGINPENVLAKRNGDFVADFDSEKLDEKDALEIIHVTSRG